MNALNLIVLCTVPISPSPDNPDIWIAHVQFSNGKADAQNDMMIDTGASVTTIPSETAEQLNLVSDQVSTATLFLNKKISVNTAQVTKMQTGDFVLLSHKVCYPDREVPGYPVSIGMDVFRGYVPLMDFGQKTMYLCTVGTAATLRPATTPKK